MLKSGAVRAVVEKDYPRLLPLLGEIMGDSLVDYAIEPPLKRWRDGEIETINQLENKIHHLAKEWPNVAKDQGLIKSGVTKWLTGVNYEIQQLLSPIFREFDISDQVLQLRFPLEIENIDTGLQINIEEISEVNNIVKNIEAVVWGSVVLSAIAVSSATIVGAGIVILLYAVFEFWRIDNWDDPVKSKKLPFFLRRRLSDSKIKENMTKTKKTMASKFSAKLAENIDQQVLLNQTVSQIENEVLILKDKINII